MVDEEKVFAWLDGELPPDEAAEVERQVAADPRLARLAEAHRTMAEGLRRTFDTVAAAPVPEELRIAAQPRSNIVEFSGWRERLARPFSGPAPQWAAMAATLALGIIVGTAIDGSGESSPIEARGGAIYAAGTVDQALESRLASAGARDGVRVGLTLRDRSGAICRSFETRSSSGLACRADGDWRLRGLFSAPEGAGAEYRMASGPDPRLMELVDSTIAGEPFDPIREAQARESGWR